MTEDSEGIRDAIPQESRLSRWARRKSEQQLGNQTEVQAQPLSEVSESEENVLTVNAEERSLEEPVLTDEDMPAVSSLGDNSDFSGFMSPGVSEGLRKLALRKMFSLASFQKRDGLDDYDDDFTNFEPLGDTVTNDPWTHRQKRLAEEKAAEEKLALEKKQRMLEEHDAIEQSEEQQDLEKVESEEQAGSDEMLCEAGLDQDSIESELQFLDGDNQTEQGNKKHE